MNTTHRLISFVHLGNMIMNNEVTNAELNQIINAYSDIRRIHGHTIVSLSEYLEHLRNAIDTHDSMLVRIMLEQFTFADDGIRSKS